MKSPVRVLYLEDDPYDKELIEQILVRGGLDCELVHARDAETYRSALCGGRPFDLIISDFSVPGLNGFEACDLAKQVTPEVPFILLSGTLSEEQAVESIKRGAVDYVIKQRLFRLVPAILRAISEAEQAQAKRQAEALLAAKTEYLRSVLDTAGAVIIAVAPDAIIHEWNAEAERVFGYSRQEAIGLNYIETFLKPEDREGPRKELAKAVNGTPVKNYESKVVARNRKERIISWNATRLDRTPPLVVAVGIDVTEERKRQEELKRTQRLDTLGSLAAGIAHDLNNVLAPVMMGVGLLEQVVPPANRKILSIIRESAERGSEMVSQILSFSRGTTVVAQVQLTTIVKAILKFARQTFPETITVEAKLEPKLWPVVGNATELHQVLLNLCVNSRDAMLEGGVLTISSQNLTAARNKGVKSDQQILLSVQDTGPGILPDILPRIFEPFFTTKPEGAVTGLGLATVMNIVKAHGGAIEVESAAGVGTRFNLYLPAALETVELTSEIPEPEQYTGNGQIILCVDNEVAVLEMIRETLESYGYRPLTYSSGVLAFEAIQSGIKPDLLLSDLRVPMMNGEAIIRLMRTVFPDLKCILMSGSGAVEEKLVQSLELAAFLKKPFTTSELLSAVKSALPQRRMEQELAKG